MMVHMWNMTCSEILTHLAYRANAKKRDISNNNLTVLKSQGKRTGPRSAVGNVSGYRCVSDCRSRGREFDPGPVPYFRGD